MATSDFLTRRLSHASGQSSNNIGMTEHLNDADPHPQYLKVTNYAGGEGEIDLSGYVTTRTFNSHVDEYNSYVISIGSWQTGINTWKADIIDWQETYGGYVDGLRSWKSDTADPAIEQVSLLATDLTNHVVRYNQNAAEDTIVSHLDTEGKELYARRLHTHTLADLNAAPDDHKHDDDYLRISDVSEDRTTPNGNSVTALSSIFANIIHPHTQYVQYEDLENAGIYPSAKNLLDANDTTSTSIDFNTILSQGIYDIHPQTGQTVLHTPGTNPNGFLVVIENQTVEGENSIDDNNGIDITIAGVRVVHQLYMCDNGTTRKRTITATDAIAYAWVSTTNSNDRIYTKTASGAASLAFYNTKDMGVPAGSTTAGNTSSIRFNGTTYNRLSAADTIGSIIDYESWHVTNAPTQIKGIVNSGTEYTMDCSNYDIQKITLNNNCTLTVSNVDAGQTVYLYVTTNGSLKLTYNNVELISGVDVGTFRIEFQHDGETVRCINVMVILA